MKLHINYFQFMSILLILTYGFPAYGAFFSRGKIDTHYSYKNLRLIEYKFDCYLYGTIVNETRKQQENVRITFQAFDIFDKKLWETTVLVEDIGPKIRNSKNEFSFGNTLKKCGNPYTLKFLVSGHKSTPKPVTIKKPIEPEHTGGYIFIRKHPTLIIIEGMENQVSECIKLQTGTHVFESEHNGSKDFILRLIGCDSNRSFFITAKKGKNSGSNNINLKKPGLFKVNVKADKHWSVKIHTLKHKTSDQTSDNKAKPVYPENETIEIILKNGEIIKTSSSWVEGQILYYKKYGGIIGIKTSEIQKINTPESNDQSK